MWYAFYAITSKDSGRSELSKSAYMIFFGGGGPRVVLLDLSVAFDTIGYDTGVKLTMSY